MSTAELLLGEFARRASASPATFTELLPGILDAIGPITVPTADDRSVWDSISGSSDRATRELDDPMLTRVWGAAVNRIEIDVTGRDSFKVTVELNTPSNGG